MTDWAKTPRNKATDIDNFEYVGYWTEQEQAVRHRRVQQVQLLLHTLLHRRLRNLLL